MPKVAGVYIERRRVRATIERVTLTDGILMPDEWKDAWRCDMNPADPISAIRELRHLAKWIRSHHRPGDPLAGLGIGSYGPFVSLRREPSSTNPEVIELGPGYGRLADITSPPPFAGVDLYRVFREPFGSDQPPSIAIQTDANVAALGEAWRIDTRPGAMRSGIVVAIVLDSGIGGGFSAKIREFDAGLHPEMGRILVNILDDDPLRKELYSKNRYKEHLGVLAGSLSMIERAKILIKEEEIQGICESLEDAFLIDHLYMWPLVSRYIADMCWRCTVTLAPTNIIIGGPMARAPNLLKHVRASFGEIITQHETPSPFKGAEASQIRFPEFRRDDYIDVSWDLRPDWRRLPFGLAGAVYLAWATANSTAGVQRHPPLDHNA